MSFIKNISPGDHSDEELVSLYRQSGELRVLGELYSRYMDLVYGVCLKYLGDEDDSKDATMQIFEELVTKVKKHEVDHFRGWLYTLAKNHCLMKIRRSGNTRIESFDPERMQFGEDGHLDSVIEKEARLERLEECIGKLNDDQKRVVNLFYLDGKGYNEIASSTGLEWNTVRSLIQNGRRNLKICMEKNEGVKGKPLQKQISGDRT